MHADDEAAAAAAAAAIDPDSADAVRRRAKSDGGGDPLEALTAVLYTRLVYVAFFIQVRLLGQIPYVGRAASLVLSALIHSCAAAALARARSRRRRSHAARHRLRFDCFEMHWGARGKGAVDKFDEIERHWLFFFGYGALLASLSLLLRFWDLFAIRAVLYPLYIANAPRARYEGYAVRRLPVFQTVTFALNGGLTMAELQMREKR